jgi:hypothetical protein
MLFPLLLAAHFIGDWVVQTDWQARWKVEALKNRQGFAAMGWHLCGYHALITIACLIAGLSNWEYLLVFATSYVTHFIIDLRAPVKWLMRRTGSHHFAQTSWGVMAVDQALHLSILSVLAAVLA